MSKVVKLRSEIDNLREMISSLKNGQKPKLIIRVGEGYDVSGRSEYRSVEAIIPFEFKVDVHLRTLLALRLENLAKELREEALAAEHEAAALLRGQE